MKQEAEIGSGCDHVSQFKAAVTTIALQHRTLLERCLLQRTKRWFAQTRFFYPSRHCPLSAKYVTFWQRRAFYWLALRDRARDLPRSCCSLTAKSREDERED